MSEVLNPEENEITQTVRVRLTHAGQTYNKEFDGDTTVRDMLRSLGREYGIGSFLAKTQAGASLRPADMDRELSEFGDLEIVSKAQGAIGTKVTEEQYALIKDFYEQYGFV